MSAAAQPYRILIVDDSPFMIGLINNMLAGHPELKVVGSAFNGKIALEKFRELNPDVITLDVEMPVMGGLETLEELKKISTVPVIMFSSLTKEGAEVTLNALELGAFDFVQKPDNNFGVEVEDVKKELIAKILAAVKSKKQIPSHPELDSGSLRFRAKPPMTKGTDKLLIIASSTGGPNAVKQVLSALPKNFPAKILLVQHMPPKFTESFAKRLNNISELEVYEAKDGDIPQAGKVFLAPGDYHMVLDEQGIIRLNQEPQVCGLRPAADITMKSAVNLYKNNIFCVVLTGMGHDGTEGAKEIKQNGGHCIAQDEESCIVYGMPKSVVDSGLADSVVPLEKIADEIYKYLEI